MFDVFYKIEIYITPNRDINSYIFMRQTGDDDDYWDLLGFQLRYNKKGLISEMIKKISQSIRVSQDNTRKYLGFISALDSDFNDYLKYDNAASDLLAVIKFDGHCETLIDTKICTEFLNDNTYYLI